MKQWWQSLSAREQRTVSIGGVMALVLGFYALIWSPLQTHINDLNNTALAQQNLAQWMQQAHANLQHASKTSQQQRPLAAEAMLSEIASSLEKAELRGELTSLTQDDAKQVQLRFDNVPFDAAMNWLSKTIQYYPIQIQELNARRTPTAGVVGLSMVLRLRR